MTTPWPRPAGGWRSAASGRSFRQERAGMAGLVLLVVAVVLALVAPLFIDDSVTSVVRATGKPFAAPSLDNPLGTDESGRSILPAGLGGSRISLLVGFLAALLRIVIGMVVGIAAGHFRGLDRGRADAGHRLVPGAAARCRSRIVLRGHPGRLARSRSSWPSASPPGRPPPG